MFSSGFEKTAGFFGDMTAKAGQVFKGAPAAAAGADVAKKSPGMVSGLIKKHPFMALGGTVLAAKAFSGPKEPPPPPPQIIQY
jgi:hypothetical protein